VLNISLFYQSFQFCYDGGPSLIAIISDSRIDVLLNELLCVSLLEKNIQMLHIPVS
jgi:hypothetical protein